MKTILPVLLVGFGLLANSAHASPREGTFDDPSGTVPTREVRAPKPRADPWRIEVAPSADRDFRRRLHDLAP